MLTSLEEKILGSIDKSRVVELCRALVRIPTVNFYSGDKNPTGEKAGHDYIKNVFKEMGAELRAIPCDDNAFDTYHVLATKGRITEGRDNTIAKFVFGDGQGPTIYLDAHMDTVAIDQFNGNPYSAEYKDGKIFGRGTSDDKGSVAAIVEAVRILQANPEGLNGTVVCCIVSEEECDGAGRGTISCVAHLPKPDYAILVDGDTNCIFDGCDGITTARMTVHGRAGHAAIGSINAIEQAFKLLPALEKFKALRGNRPGVCNFGVFQAGNHPANVPSEAVLAFNIKTYLEDMAESVKAYGLDNGRLVRELFEKCIQEIVTKDEILSAMPPSIVWTKDMPAARASSVDKAFVDFCAQVWSDVTGRIPDVAPMSGWGDLAHFIRAGVPTVGIGTGMLGKSHSADEFTTDEALVDAAKAVAIAVSRKLRK